LVKRLSARGTQKRDKKCFTFYGAVRLNLLPLVDSVFRFWAFLNKGEIENVIENNKAQIKHVRTLVVPFYFFSVPLALCELERAGAGAGARGQSTQPCAGGTKTGGVASKPKSNQHGGSIAYSANDFA
jgi:hypothetical protein